MAIPPIDCATSDGDTEIDDPAEVQGSLVLYSASELGVTTPAMGRVMLPRGVTKFEVPPAEHVTDWPHGTVGVSLE